MALSIRGIDIFKDSKDLYFKEEGENISINGIGTESFSLKKKDIEDLIISINKNSSFSFGSYGGQGVIRFTPGIHGGLEIFSKSENRTIPLSPDKFLKIYDENIVQGKRLLSIMDDSATQVNGVVN